MTDVLPVTVTAEMDERYQGCDARRLEKLVKLLENVLTKDENNPPSDVKDRKPGVDYATPQKAAANCDCAEAELEIVELLLTLVAPAAAAQPTGSLGLTGRERLAARRGQ